MAGENIVLLIKRAAMEAVEASKPARFRYGTVKTVSPLTVKVSDKLILESGSLVVPERLSTEGALNAGDAVVILQNKGGQQYLIMDKVVSAS